MTGLNILFYTLRCRAWSMESPGFSTEAPRTIRTRIYANPSHLLVSNRRSHYQFTF